MGLAETHLASSRTLDFRAKFLATTDGHGMDVVLDCLAGELVDASLDLLPNGGRFLKVGNTDIRDPGDLLTEYPHLSYRAFDLMDAGPERLQEILLELRGLFEQGRAEAGADHHVECAPRAAGFETYASQARTRG